MQKDIDVLDLPVSVGIIGVNGTDAASGNAAACEGRDLPWLQETLEVPAWSLWQVAYRDVIVLDEDNRRIAVYNLTEHDLNDSAHYEELKALLVAAAGGGAAP
jgi:hypothetical protein